MNLDLIIPTYNRSQMLARCLDSVREARVPTDMIPVVWVADNNSVDDTKTVIERYSQAPGIPIRYLHAAKQGRSAAMNFAIERSNSEFVGFVDDDERLAPQWFEAALREFRDPAVEYIGGPAEPDWSVPAPDWIPSTYNGVLAFSRRPEPAWFSRDYPGILMGGNAVFRRSTLVKVMPYPEQYGKIHGKIRAGEDEIVYERLLNIGAKGRVVPDLVIYHYIPPERVTKSYYRKWVFQNSRAKATMTELGAERMKHLFGIPRYRYRQFLSGVSRMITARTKPKRFEGQLMAIEATATFIGRHFRQGD